MNSIVWLDIEWRVYATNYNTLSNLQVASHFNCKIAVVSSVIQKKIGKKTKNRQKLMDGIIYQVPYQIDYPELFLCMQAIFWTYKVFKTTVILGSLKVSSQKSFRSSSSQVHFGILSENMQQIYKRTPMLKLLHIFRTSFLKTSMEGCFWRFIVDVRLASECVSEFCIKRWGQVDLILNFQTEYTWRQFIQGN